MNYLLIMLQYIYIAIARSTVWSKVAYPKEEEVGKGTAKLDLEPYRFILYPVSSLIVNKTHIFLFF
jgi:hypothetical protein